MTDITKCSGEGCALREDCWRYLAPAGHWQSWFAAPPIGPDGTCDHRMPRGIQ